MVPERKVCEMSALLNSFFAGYGYGGRLDVMGRSRDVERSLRRRAATADMIFVLRCGVYGGPAGRYASPILRIASLPLQGGCAMLNMKNRFLII